LLVGRQRRFCSRECKHRDTNVRLQNCSAQQRRGSARKRALMAGRGTQCARCSYGRNSAALTWHHRVPEDERFDLDLRAFSNRSMAELEAEAAKCDLLCANCHAEVHHPDSALTPAPPR
jgi:hypothetical protein